MVHQDLQAVIFDFDGVVCNSEAIHFDATIHALKIIGIEFSYETYTEHYVGLPDHMMFPIILEQYNQDICLETIKQLNAKKVSYYQTTVRGSRLKACPGFGVFFKQIEGRVKRAVCTSSRMQEIQTALPLIETGYSLSSFDCVTCIDDVPMGKPAPDGYLLTTKKLALTPDQCIAIEDTPVGIRAAHEAGIPVIGITTTQPKERLFDADWVISSLDSKTVHDIFTQSLLVSH